MQSILLLFLFSIILPKLKTEYEISFGIFPVAFAERARTATFAPENFKSGTYYGYNIKITSDVFGTTTDDCSEDNGIIRNFHFVDDDGECAYSSCSTSSLSLCLRPLTPWSTVCLRTLYRRHKWKENNEEFADKNLKYKHIDFCWKSVRDIEKQMAYRPMVSPSKMIHDCPVGVIISNHSSSQSKKSFDNNVNEAVRLKSLARKLDLLFDTVQVESNEISLPRSIAELFRQKRSILDSDTTAEIATSSKPHSYIFSSTPLSLSKFEPVIETLRADPVIDLTGRWRPAKTLSAQDLIDYDEFLKACCSDKLSYWTRKLLTSTSVVSRQEFVVKQSNEGRTVEFFDMHPLSSIVWNRTIVTNMDYDRVKLNSNRFKINHLKDPQGDPIIIEAYWEENGTVHTSLLRKYVHDKIEDCSTNQGWLKTRRYLYSGKRYFDTADQKEENKVMIVETTYYATIYPTDVKLPDNNRLKTNGFVRLDKNEDIATRMVWKWEQAIGLSS